MQLYEPGPYKQFVDRLISSTENPDPDIWRVLSNRLDEIDLKKKRARFRRFYSTASISLLLVIGSISVFYYQVNFLTFENRAWTSVSFDLNIHSDKPLAELTYNNVQFSDNKHNAAPQTNIDLFLGLNSEIIKDSLLNPIRSLPYKNFNTPIKEKQVLLKDISMFSVSSIVLNNKSNVNNTKDLSNPWSIIASISPSYTNHTVAALNFKTNENEAGAMMWGGEILVKRKINKYFSVYSGLMLNPLGQNIGNLVLLRSISNDKNIEYLYANTSYGEINLNNQIVGITNFATLNNGSLNNDETKASPLNTANIKQRFYYLELPLLFATNFSNNLFNAQLKLGGAIGTLVDNKFEVISPEGHFFGKNENIRQYNASALGSVCISFPINNHVSLIIEPNLKLNLRPLSRIHEATYPFSASIKLGVGYQF